ncbi:MAG: PIN domain-containing protein [Promicromonosporaceae bacterium]|nr:PIN domain-containing protein [Promicromonosporaceae bacterium]
MGRRLIVDTTALIEFERTQTIRGLRPSDDVAIAPVSLAEFYRGVVAAPNERIRIRRREFYDQLSSGESFRLLHYTPATAEEHGELLAFVNMVGQPRGPYDLIIAAHARETGRHIHSCDAKARFGDLPGVSTIEWAS